MTFESLSGVFQGRDGTQLPTYPQFTQAIVPWPFTVWATSDSSFRWESPDVSASTARPFTPTSQ